MLQINKTQFAAIKKHFATLRSELNKDKLAEFAKNVEFFLQHAPYAAADELATRVEWTELALEVKSACRASLIPTGETQTYRKFKANCEAGIKTHPDSKSSTYADVMSQLRANSELRELVTGLAGMTKADLRRELPK